MAKPSRRDKPWQFYVYEIVLLDEVVYIGKGTGQRLRDQKRRHCADGREVARFWREADAYAFERQLISEKKPRRNRHPGGSGKTITPKRAERVRPMFPEFDRHCRLFGTRDAARKMLINFGLWNKQQQLEYEQTIRFA